MKEIWKDIPDYEGLYQVSDQGHIKSLLYDKLLKPRPNKKGYLRCALCRNGKAKESMIHRLVLLAFIGKSDLYVNHKNAIKSDNRLENLEYCTADENSYHAWELGLYKRKQKKVLCSVCNFEVTI